jgi:hypothetical protein
VLDHAKHPVSQAIRRFAETEVIPGASVQNEQGRRLDRRGLMRKRRPRS